MELLNARILELLAKLHPAELILPSLDVLIGGTSFVAPDVVAIEGCPVPPRHIGLVRAPCRRNHVARPDVLKHAGQVRTVACG